MTIKLVDRFTTEDGQWLSGTGKEFAIPHDKLRKYSVWNIPGRGAAVHIMVYAPVGSRVVFNTDDGNNETPPRTVPASGWVDMPMGRKSGYDPDVQDGPWHVWVNGVKVTADNEGIGLPRWHHVSTFLIVEDVDDDVDTPTHPPAPEGQYVEMVVRTMRDGLQVKEQVVWRSR